MHVDNTNFHSKMNMALSENTINVFAFNRFRLVQLCDGKKRQYITLATE